MKKYLLKSGLIALSLYMLLPLSVAASDYYSVRIGGWIFNSDFLTMDNSNNDAIVSGSATYNPSTNTLTLNNLVCEMEDYNFIILVDDGSPLETIQLVGNCVFRSSYGGSEFSFLINRLPSITVTGSGSLTMEYSGNSYAYGLRTDYFSGAHNIIVKDTSIKMKYGADAKGYGIYMLGSSVCTIDNSDVEIDMTDCSDNNVQPAPNDIDTNNVMVIEDSKYKHWIPLDGVERNINPYNDSHGSAYPDMATAHPGETVSIDIMPNNGYGVETLTVTDSDGREVKLLAPVNWSSRTARFIMVNKDVSINATFKELTESDYVIQAPAGRKSSEVIEYDIPESVTSLKFYDSGGPDGNYSDSENYIIAMNAPSGYVFDLKTNNGNYVAEGAVYDYLFLGEGTGNEITTYRWSGYRNGNARIQVTTTGQRLLAHFVSDNGNNRTGWDIDVRLRRIEELDRNHTVTPVTTGGDHGTVTLSQTEAAKDEQIIYEVTADDGYYANDIIPRDADDNVLYHYTHYKLVGGEAKEFYFFYMPDKDATLNVDYIVMPTVTIVQQPHATVYYSPANPTVGETVTVWGEVDDENYAIQSYTFTYPGGGSETREISPANVWDYSITFDMPTTDITITPVVVLRNTVTCNATEHGTISTPTPKPNPNANVRINAVPEDNYYLTYMTYTYNGATHNVTNADMWLNYGTFAMPYDYDVTVDATFVAKNDLTRIYIPSNSSEEFNLENRSIVVTPKLGTDSKYLNNMNGSLTINVPAGKTIKITGTAQTETNYDHLYIYDGTSSDTQLLDYCNSATTDLDLQTTGNKMTLKFTSDQSTGRINNEYFITVVDEKDVEVTLGETGYATLYYSDRNLRMPERLASSTYYIYNNKLTYSGAHTVIPAGEAVVLNGTPNTTYTLYNETTCDESPDARNLLKGTDDAQTISTAGYKYFILSLNAAQEAGSVGFYYQAGTEGNSVSNGAHKAYLRVPLADLPANVMGYRIIDGGEVTAIDAISVDNNDFNNAVIYTIDGRKVSATNLQKGVYIIDGKKKVVK